MNTGTVIHVKMAMKEIKDFSRLVQNLSNYEQLKFTSDKFKS